MPPPDRGTTEEPDAETTEGADATGSIDAPAETDGSGRRGWRVVPRSVWALTVLFGLLLATSSVAAPLFLAPDEFVHADLALRLADDPHYPAFDGRRTSVAVKRVAIPYFSPDARTPDKAADEAPPKAGRPSIGELGGSGDDPAGSYNQQPQHPPLYYQLLGLALRVARKAIPGSPALVTEIALLRLLNAAMVVLLPLAAWATAHRLGAGRATATTAAALTLTIPQLTHIGSTINNDNLLIALASGLAVLLAGVLRGDRSARTAVLVGLVAGLAVLTKATALLLLPWIAVAYLVAARRASRRGERPLPVILTGAVTAVVAGVVAGWWFIGNRQRTGSFAPTLEETLIPDQPGFDPDTWWFARRFGAFFVERFWGWFGLYSARMPLPVIAAASVALVAVIVAGLWGRGREVRRTDLLVGLVPVALLFAFVLQHSWSIYARSGHTPFIQGRYLFPAVVSIVVVGAVGLRRLTGAWAALVALGAGLVLHAIGFATMLDQFWGAPGEGVADEVRSLVAWSAWPGEALAVGAIVAAVVGGAAVVVAITDLRPSREDGAT